MNADFNSLLQDFLRIESTTDHPENLNHAVDFISAILKKTPGISVERFSSNGKPSLLAYFGPRRPERFKVLMNGHVDVVAAAPEQFQPYVKDGKLYARGAGDMKTAALIMALAFCDLAPKLKYPLGLQIVADEEVGGLDGTKYQISQGVTSEFVIIGECAAPGTLSPEARGICWADVHFSGQPAHGAYPWRGDNAALSATQFIEKLLKTYPIPRSDQWVTTANVAYLTTSNTTNNRVPGDAKVGLDIRYVLDDSNFSSKDSAEQFLNNLLPSAKTEITLFEPAYAIDRQNPILQKLIEMIQKDVGRPIELVRRYGSSDARFYGALGTPTITFGLPDHNIHANDEYIELEWISRYQQILVDFLQAI